MSTVSRIHLLVGLASLVVAGLPSMVQAQTPTVLHFCYVPGSGLVYRIPDAAGSDECRGRGHVAFSFTEGVPGHDHGALTGLSDDDHPEYVREGEAAGGDLTGTYPAPVVSGLVGRSISTAAPSDGQVLAWDDASSAWGPADPAAAVGDHGGLQGLVDDDHPHYLLTDGVRAATDGFAVTGSVGGGTAPASGAGVRLAWYPGKAAFRAGDAFDDRWDDGRTGVWSAAFGRATEASGEAAIAWGNGAVASGAAATAGGFRNNATGDYSTALGASSDAGGAYATVIGSAASANGDYSTAFGRNAHASGDYSLAVGNAARAQGDFAVAMGAGAQAVHDRAFVFAGGPILNSFAASSFTAGVPGGARFYTDATNSSGVWLPGGGGAWATLSDRAMKENFREIDGESVLARIKTLSIPEWNYTTQDASVRHVGPTAQDFFSAFGLGSSDRTITTSDISGINLLAIQALERRANRLKEENTDLQARLGALEAALARLEAALGEAPSARPPR